MFPAKAQRRKEMFPGFLCVFAPLREKMLLRVKKQTLIHTLIYGLCGGILIVVLRLIEFRFLVVEHSIEIYGGLIAALFASLGIWLGLKLTKNEKSSSLRKCPSQSRKSSH